MITCDIFLQLKKKKISPSKPSVVHLKRSLDTDFPPPNVKTPSSRLDQILFTSSTTICPHYQNIHRPYSPLNPDSAQLTIFTPSQLRKPKNNKKTMELKNLPNQSLKMTEPAISINGIRQSGENFLANI